MPLTLCPYVYNPIETTTFTVHFDTVVGTHEQNQRAERVITHLSGLEHEALLRRAGLTTVSSR